MDLLLSVPSLCIVLLFTPLGYILGDVPLYSLWMDWSRHVFMRMEICRFSHITDTHQALVPLAMLGHRTPGVPDPDCHCCDTFVSTSIPGLPSPPSLRTIGNLRDPLPFVI